MVAGRGVVHPSGHTVFRVSTQKAHDQRRFLSRHAKSNTIDAHTLARLPLIDPGGLHPVHLPDTRERAALDRRVRATARLTDEIRQHKRRLIELARQAMPTIGAALAPKLSRTDLAVLERYGDPRKLAAVRRDRLITLITKASHHHGDPAPKADALRTAAREAVDLDGEDPAICFDALAEEIATEIRLIRTLEAEQDRHAAVREVNRGGSRRGHDGCEGGHHARTEEVPRRAAPARGASGSRGRPAWRDREGR
ncbi:IS110 family transposase, partial [Nitriliruptoraceae bacterium ZYF776]|nr:IS110 family transposase [Profundirhabdus halotolerans]